MPPQVIKIMSQSAKFAPAAKTLPCVYVTVSCKSKDFQSVPKDVQRYVCRSQVDWETATHTRTIN